MVGAPSPTMQRTTSIAVPDDTTDDLVASLERSPSSPASVLDRGDVLAGLDVLAGWRERVALRVDADSVRCGGPVGVVDDQDVVSATSEVVAGWTAEARSTSPVLASERVRALAGLAEVVAAAQAALVAVVEGSAQHAVEGAPSAVAWLTAETGVSAGAAKRTVAVGRLVERFDATRAAVESGVVSIPKAEVLAGAVLAKGRGQVYERDEAVLVEAARTLPTAEFAKVVRRWADLADDDLDNGEPEAALARRGVSFARLASGNLRIAGELDAAGGAALEAAFVAYDRPDPVDDETCPPRTVAQRRADFLVALAARALAETNGAAGGPVATIDVIVDLERLAAAVPALVAGPADGNGHDHNDNDHHHDHDHDDHDQGHIDRAEPGDQDDRGSHDEPGHDPRHDRRGQPADDDDRGRQRGSPPTLGDLLAVLRPDPHGWGDAIGVGPLPVHLLAQLACDCWMGRTVMAGPSVPLDVGRRRRTFTDDQRRAIVARDRHCTHPRCTRGPEWCQIHHLDDWDHDGPTDIANGTLRCTWHHTWHHLQQRQRRLHRTITTATR
ncbi:MAG: DUF222 domain-containing protein [Acidimicrobiales bacterium]